ncbi:MAG: hypothetical protein ACKOED_10020 [Aestuariivirga sp.]|uniref:hypothetical protein n=1 Tax=Aestuariivirga sp. TaxID=2650926 RepID=UPI0038D20650
MSTELSCIAGRREASKGRYSIVDLAEEDAVEAIARFQEDIRALKKVALVCIIPRTRQNMDPRTPSIEVLRELSVFGARVSSMAAEQLLNSAVLELPVLLNCPVTGSPTTYSFFGVALCPQAANDADELFDLPLSAPFPCINFTSDAFAFAMFVRDVSMNRHGVPPHELASRRDCDALFAACVAQWHKFSSHTLTAFARKTAGTRCPVRISADGLSWHAAHNDPVFAETRKEQHAHDMPCIYATELVERWVAVLDRHSAHFHVKSGQGGGILIAQVANSSKCPLAAMKRTVSTEL